MKKKEVVKTISIFAAIVGITNISLDYYLRKKQKERIWIWLNESGNSDKYHKYIEDYVQNSIKAGRRAKYLPVRTKTDLIYYSVDDMNTIEKIIQKIKNQEGSEEK